MRFADSADFDIRYTLPEDGEHLLQWLQVDGMLRAYPPSDPAEVELFIRIWMGFVRFKAGLTATYQGKPVGMGVIYLMPYRKVSHLGMVQLIVDPEQQNRGVGYRLLKNLKHLGATRFRLESLYVEIFGEGVAVSLFSALDFRQFARQEKYVKEGELYFPRILMRCSLI